MNKCIENGYNVYEESKNGSIFILINFNFIGIKKYYKCSCCGYAMLLYQVDQHYDICKKKPENIEDMQFIEISEEEYNRIEKQNLTMDEMLYEEKLKQEEEERKRREEEEERRRKKEEEERRLKREAEERVRMEEEDKLSQQYALELKLKNKGGCCILL